VIFEKYFHVSALRFCGRKIPLEIILSLNVIECQEKIITFCVDFFFVLGYNSSMEFAESLKKIRKALKLSQHDLARRMGIAQSTVGMWETGKRTPKLDEINRLATALNITVDRLISRGNKKVEIIGNSIYIDGEEVEGLDALDIERIVANVRTCQRAGKSGKKDLTENDIKRALRGHKILIIDDEKEMCELLYSYLVPHNYKVFITFNGQMGLEYFNEISPDVVFLDLGLPDIDGKEVLGIIRKVSNVPIVVITGNPRDIVEIHLKDLSIEGFISKPFSVEEILNTLKLILG
jgi:CheY-like chemotaxis protein/DNA-binding XRE family transcriptional regulator